MHIAKKVFFSFFSEENLLYKVPWRSCQSKTQHDYIRFIGENQTQITQHGSLHPNGQGQRTYKFCVDSSSHFEGGKIVSEKLFFHTGSVKADCIISMTNSGYFGADN